MVSRRGKTCNRGPSEAISKSQLKLIGGAHSLAKVQDISAHLFETEAGSGYDSLVIETDPFAATEVSRVVTVDDEEWTDCVKQRPMAMPFFPFCR